MTGARLRSAVRDDFPALEALLSASDLPVAGVREAVDGFVVAELDGAVVGAAGLERYGNSVLLRSVAVAPPLRGTGLGERLVAMVLEAATRSGAEACYLLTTTAEQWFPRFGFERITRAEVPAPVHQSLEFTEACPASAIVMRRRLSAEGAS